MCTIRSGYTGSPAHDYDMVMHANNPSATALLLSGGIDSAALLDQLLRSERRVLPFYVRTGCVWERCELRAVQRLLAELARPRLAELLLLEMPLADLYGDHWSITGRQVPDDASPDAAVYLPGRNPLLMLKPALWCAQHGVERLALGTLAGNPFDDATTEFFARFEAMLHAATGQRVRIIRPLEHLPKHRVLELARHLPLEWTFSCLSPAAGLHCGRCNKCAERRRAFRRLKIADPTVYSQAYSVEPIEVANS
jgi:7-cyano-7-deazaguanine synthase